VVDFCDPLMTVLTHTSFQEFVRSNQIVIIHFWAAWNIYDARMKDLLVSKIPPDLAEIVSLGMLDVDPQEHHDLCKEHRVLNLPFLAFYQNGSLARTVVGMREPEVIIAYLQELVA
jgi:hypothetical protein